MSKKPRNRFEPVNTWRDDALVIAISATFALALWAAMKLGLVS
jgi:hypothetical protein